MELTVEHDPLFAVPPKIDTILSRSLAVLTRGFVPLMTIALLVTAPFSLLFQVLKWIGGADDFSLTQSLTTLQRLIVGPIATGALVYGVFHLLRGEPWTVERCFRVVFRRLVPLLVASVLVWLATTAGFLLCIVPGVIAACGLYVATPALVVERLGPIEALQRSWELTREHRMTIFGLWFLAFVVMVLIGGALLGLGIVEPGRVSGLAWLIDIPLTALTTTISGVFAGVVYHDLRLFKEGLQEDDLAAVFD